MSAAKREVIPPVYKAWFIVSLAVLLISLVMFTGAIVAWFVYFMQKFTPLWVTVLGVFGVLGFGAGLGGLILVMILCGRRTGGEDGGVREPAKTEPPKTEEI